MTFHVSGFSRGAALGDSCVTRVFQPAGNNAGGQAVPARMGEAQFKLLLQQN
jgi:hypothetical protein